MGFSFNPFTSNFDNIAAVSVGSFSASSTAQGLVLNGTVLSLTAADATNPGGVSTSTQSFGGNKTFTGTIVASNLSGTNTGDVSFASFGATPSASAASLSGQIITLQPADGSNPGGVSTTTQTFAGNKTFSGTIAASNFSGSSSGTNSGDVTLSTYGSTPNSNGASLSGQILTLQPADGSNSGGVSTTTQTFSGAKTFSNDAIFGGTVTTTGVTYANGGIDTTAATTLAIGTINATTINIGNAGATVNIQGTVITETTNTLNITDPIFTLNKGGSGGSASGSGMEIEEASSITGYAKTSGDRNSWTFKAPNTAGIISLTPGVSGFTINQASHDPLTLGAVGASPNANGASLSTQVLTLQPADGSNPGVITTGSQIFSGAKTFLGTISASNLSGTNTGDVTIGTANGLSLIGQQISLAAAGAAAAGAVTTGTQTFAGSKTFSSTIIGPTSGNVVSSTGDIAETSFTIADNQVAAANVTGLAFANGVVRAFECMLSILKSGNYEFFHLRGIQTAADWYLSVTSMGDTVGVSFTITTAGQIQYVSTSTGASGTAKFRAWVTTL
jgi:hypothetical protein